MNKLLDDRGKPKPVISIVGFGSSVGVGATLSDPAVDAPVAYFTLQLKAALDPGAIYDWQVSNHSQNGSIAANFSAFASPQSGYPLSAWGEVLAAGITPDVCVFAYGMNDFQPANFNAGETFPGFSLFLTDAVLTCQKVGADVVIMTSPHPAVVTHDLWVMPAGTPQNYPTFVAADVAPEQLTPAASASNITSDFLGNGIPITMGWRFLQGNQAMRDVAARTGSPVIDAERHWMKAIQTYQLSSGSASGAEDALFDPGQCVHPNLLGHKLSYHASVDDFIRSLGAPKR